MGNTLQLAISLAKNKKLDEARIFLRKWTPAVERELGPKDELTLKLRSTLATVLALENPTSSLGDLREGARILEDIYPISQQIFGAHHPTTKTIRTNLDNVRGREEQRMQMIASIKHLEPGPMKSQMESEIISGEIFSESSQLGSVARGLVQERRDALRTELAQEEK